MTSEGRDRIAARSPWRRLGALGRVVAALLPLAATVWGCGRAAAPLPRDPNVLLVTLDTVRADRLDAYGWSGGDTPHLDALARQGARFDDVMSAAPLTLPSHATILSGLLPPEHGLRDNGAGSFPADRPTLATVLAAAGYRTGAFVGAFVLDHRFGLDRGFDVYDDEVNRGQGDEPQLQAERPGAEVVDRALAWLRKADERPFFAWVHLYDAHAPYEPPEPFRHRADLYEGEIAYVDAQVGRLLEELSRRGLDGRTVVAVAADHGESLGEHGELTHGLLLYQPTLRVPLLVRAPGIAAGTTVGTPVSLVDLAPTLAGLAGHPFPGAAGKAPHGRDLAASLRTGEEPPPEELYAETRYPRNFGWSALSALRRRNLKYIRAPRPELYDLARDPGESDDLAAERPRDAAGFADRLAELARGARTAAPPAGDDAETRARLASLGYAVSHRPAQEGEAATKGADPKDMVKLFHSFEEATWAIDEGRIDEARKRLEKLVSADPGNPVFRSSLAKTLRRQGDLGHAVALYEQAVARAPNDPDGWYNLAVTLQEAGRHDEALHAIQEAIRRDPGRPEAHNVLGISLAEGGHLEEAQQEFRRALDGDPRNAQAWNNLGNTLRELGRLSEAADAYRRAVDLAPRYPDPLNGLGTLAVAQDHPKEALPYFEKALAIDPGLHEVRLNRAIALDLAGERQAAIRAYRDFLAAAHDDPSFAPQRQAAERLLARLSQGG